MIRRRGPKKYTIIIYLGRDEKGKKINHTETFHGTYQEAKQKEIELKAKLQCPKQRSLMSLNRYFDRWLEDIQDSISENTFRTYAWHVSKLKPFIGDLILSDELTGFQLQERLKGKLNNLAHKTQMGIYTTLRTALKQAKAWGIVSNDLTAGLRTPRKKRAEQKALTPDELIKFLEAIKGYKHHAVLRLLAVTGMRISEVLGLKWKDIDLHNGMITVSRAADIRKRKLNDDTKTPASKRTIKLDDETVATLLKHRETQARSSVAPLKKRDGLVFRSEDGRVLRYGAIWRTLKRALKKAGIDHIRIHDLRHTAGSILLDAGSSLADVASFLGHSTPGTTATIYAHKVRGGRSVIAALHDNRKVQKE